jgi:hypothetical protein
MRGGRHKGLRAPLLPLPQNLETHVPMPLRMGQVRHWQEQQEQQGQWQPQSSPPQ